jgi:dihydroorotase
MIEFFLPNFVLRRKAANGVTQAWSLWKHEMAETYDSILIGGMVVGSNGIGVRDIGIRAGKTTKIGDLAQASARERIGCKGLHILPGVIDTHVHFREPGAHHKEDMESGSRSAVLGGVTAVFEMPNTDPPTISAETLADKVQRGHHRMHCDFAFFIGGTHENFSKLPELERLPGAAGIKVFMGSSTGKLLVGDDEGLRKILKVIRRRASIHAEDEPRLVERKNLRVEGDPSSHPVWRDEIAALKATMRLMTIARETGARVHVLHVSTAEEVKYFAENRDVASIEVTPQHLTLAAPDCYARVGTLAQMNPPLRDALHRETLWWGVANGLTDVLGSDHAPHTLDEKAKPYPASPSGMPGVQTLVPVMLDHVNARRLTLERFVDLSSTAPARLFDIVGKGSIVEDNDADFTIVDLKRQETIRNSWIGSRCGWTPYDGMKVTGWPVGTVVRGQRVMWEGEIVTPSQGEAVRFKLN